MLTSLSVLQAAGIALLRKPAEQTASREVWIILLDSNHW